MFKRKTPGKQSQGPFGPGKKSTFAMAEAADCPIKALGEVSVFV